MMPSSSSVLISRQSRLRRLRALPTSRYFVLCPAENRIVAQRPFVFSCPVLQLLATASISSSKPSKRIISGLVPTTSEW